MNTGMKMLVLANRGGMESKYRDRRGREHRENGDYAVRNDYGGTEMTGEYGRNEMTMGRSGYGNMEMGMDTMESRRRRDGRGRFRSEMGEMNGGDMGMDYSGSDMRSEMRGYPNRPFPVYEGGGDMNQIGFNANRGEVQTNYRMNATHHTGNEMESKPSPKLGGGYFSKMSMPMTKEIAEEWTKNMKNEDGSKGPHWTMEQVKQVMAQKGIDCNPVEMYAILNALYSDYCSVLKKWNINKLEFYIDLACAWLNDQDAMPNKAALYYEHIVKK